MNKPLPQAIVETLCYFQIFSYPVTISELYKYLHYHKRISYPRLLAVISKNPALFEVEGQYVVLRGDLKFIKKRNAQAAGNKKKMAKAILISNILAFIPFIKLIGVSGGVSMQNAKKHDDIDLFFITKKNTVWITRLLVQVILLLLQEKRKRGSRFEQDKICPNMFLSEDVLKMPKKNRTIYTAHEVAQLKVLLSKNQMYQKFLFENRWTLKFLPHAFKEQKKYSSVTLFSWMLRPIDRVFFFMQYTYMKKRVTSEYITPSVIMFHPVPYAKMVQELFEIKIKAQKNQMKKRKIEEKRALEYAIN
ncbi:MAG: hypothetical protein ACM3IJ_03180 [Candidatus Levyibacteriota bacterium]